MNKKIQIGVVLLAVSMMSCGCGKSAQNAGDVPELIEAVGVDMDTAVGYKDGSEWCDFILRADCSENRKDGISFFGKY